MGGPQGFGAVVASEPSSPDEHGATAQRLALESALRPCYNGAEGRGYWYPFQCPVCPAAGLTRPLGRVKGGGLTVGHKLLMQKRGDASRLIGQRTCLETR